MGKYRLTYDPTTAITIATGKGKENNGPLQLTSNWGKSLLRIQDGFCEQKPKGCSTKKLMVHNLEEIKEQFLNDIVAVVEVENIPDELILNWDHTAINIVPGSSWTMNQKGEK